METKPETIQDPNRYSNIFEHFRRDDEGSIRFWSGVVVTIGAVAAAGALWTELHGGIHLWGKGEAKSSPAVVTGEYTMNEQCYAGYDMESTTTAKYQSYMSVKLPLSNTTITRAVPTAWRSETVGGTTDVQMCQKAEQVNYTYDTGKGTMDISVPYDALDLHAYMPIDLKHVTEDGGVVDVLAKNFTNEVGIFTDGGLVAESNNLDSNLMGIAEGQNIENAVENCTPLVWGDFAEAQFVKANQANITSMAAALHVEAPKSINVHFTGTQPEAHSQYQDALKNLADEQEVSIESSTGQCSISPNVTVEAQG